MKIIAGQLGGQTFQSPKGHQTRPMSDKVRGALFNILGDISGLEILDAFGGSGALSFESISRGAKNVIIIEVDRRAQNIIAENIKTLGVDNRISLICAKAGSWLSTNQDDKFDVILADPPYDDLQPTLLQSLIPRLAKGGIFVLSYPLAKEELPLFKGYEQVLSKDYGDAGLVFYRQVA